MFPKKSSLTLSLQRINKKGDSLSVPVCAAVVKLTQRGLYLVYLNLAEYILVLRVHRILEYT